ncbi:MAG: alpha/beta fold hydrolase [Actinomycetota bacterium]
MAQTTTSNKKASNSASLRERILAPIPLQDRRIQAAGISTAVLEGGDGPPLVLLHGPGEFAATWTRVIPDLVAINRVIVPDLPGHGASEVNGPLDPDRVLDWLDDPVVEQPAAFMQAWNAILEK